jgi:hypothetical protein
MNKKQLLKNSKTSKIKNKHFTSPGNTFYGIQNKTTKVLLSLSVSGTGSTESYECSLQEDRFTKTPWLTTSKEIAKKLLEEGIDWYNSNLECQEMLGCLMMVNLKTMKL